MGAGSKLRLVNTRCHLFGQNFILQMFLMPGLLEQVLGRESSNCSPYSRKSSSIRSPVMDGSLNNGTLHCCNT